MGGQQTHDDARSIRELQAEVARLQAAPAPAEGTTAVAISGTVQHGCEFVPGLAVGQGSGSRLKVTAKTKEACCTSCHQDMDCVAAVFEKQTCWLKPQMELRDGFARSHDPEAITCTTSKAPAKTILPRTVCSRRPCFTAEHIESCKAASMMETSFIHNHMDPMLKTDQFPELMVRGAGLMPSLVLELMQYYKGGALSEARILKSNEATKQAFPSLGEPPIKTLEIGIGTNNSALISTMWPGGTPGASNRAFRELLPADSLIYAADVDKDILYQEERIKTTWVDQLDRKALNNMLVNLDLTPGDGLHLIIDDGLHMLPPNMNVLLFALHNIRKGGWIVIEDIMPKMVKIWTEYIDAILRTNPAYQTALVTSNDRAYCYLVQRLV